MGSLAGGLHDPLTGFDDVSIAYLVFRGDQTWGTVVQSDVDKEKESVTRALVEGTPLVEQFDKKMATFRQLEASGFSTSGPDMFRNARTLCASQPELNGYLMDYLRTHIQPASQIWQTLIPHVVQLASVMG
jgi:chaperonin GroEL (HSP60 family)